MLDARPLRTPGRNPVIVPTEALAWALAAEWEWLPNGKPVMHLMPLMGLAATALDQPKPRGRVIDDLLKYATTDAACVRYEPGPLADRQAATFDPLLAWAAAELGWQLSATDDLLGPSPPADTLAAVRAYLEGLDAWRLAAAEQLTAACKSVVLAAAVLRGRVRPEDALAAARLEEEFQIEDWGMVEAGHDLDAADLKTRVLAPAVFVRLLGGGLGGLGSGGSDGAAVKRFATSAGGAP
jgi:ATP synthase F1 complex assembly factor 2